MKASKLNHNASRQTSSLVRRRLERGGERLWRYEDFCDQPFPAVAQAFSRLVKAGAVERLSKGIYYCPRQTSFGKSKPNPSELQKLAAAEDKFFPAGMSAASMLGFTTQNPKNPELATCSTSVPKKLLGENTVVHTRRPEAWRSLSELDGALLDFLRNGGKYSELSASQTIEKTWSMLLENGRYKRLLKVSATEPPRVRAMLGALGEQLAESERSLKFLKASLNSLSRFDFGVYSALSNASKWYAKTN